MASVVVGGLGIFWSSNAIKDDSAEILDLMTQVQTVGINSMFSDIEHSAAIFSYYVENKLENFDVFADDKLFGDYIESLKNCAFYIAACTPNALSICLRFSSDIIGYNRESFLLARKDGEFVSISADENPDYDADADDIWYHKADLRKHGNWTTPYYRESLNEYVVSYSLPVFYKGKFIAVIGMDIDFDDIAYFVNSISIYKTGYAFLTDENFTVLYHRRIPSGVKVFAGVKKFKKIEVKNHDFTFYEYVKASSYRKNKEQKFRIAYKDLDNGMKLAVTVPVEEIDSQRTRLIISLLISVLGISVFVSLLSMIVSNRISNPLKELALSARHIVAGNYDLKFSRIPNDEVGELIGSFSFMAKSLERQFEYINNLAYFDAMTGAKNKRAFIDERDDLNAKIKSCKEKGENLEFALIVFDVNYLKFVNDSFGHKAGDILIKNACNLIIKNFIHSSVFRIGGDEFVAVVKDKDYTNRVELLAELKTECTPLVQDEMPSPDSVSLAAGMAAFDSQKDTDFQSVFERADEEMYKAKIAMKGGRDKIRD